MMSEILEHKRRLHHLSIDSKYLKQLLDEKLKGKDGYGNNMQDRLRKWIESLEDSYNTFQLVCDWLIPLLIN